MSAQETIPLRPCLTERIFRRAVKAALRVMLSEGPALRAFQRFMRWRACR